MKAIWKKLVLHIVWLFIIGAVFGFIFETAWHFIKNGELINKQGMWYGPLKPIYGVGVILITACLYKIKDKNSIYIFLGGFIVGTLYEYFCSYFQEFAFGTYTWTYNDFALNINGRIYLPYCAAWGAISYVWIKYCLPLYLSLFNKLYSKRFIIITYLLFIFLIYNTILTILITTRYSERAKMIEPQNTVMKIIDESFSNNEFEKKFPKLRVISD